MELISKKRDCSLDILRAIAIVGIFIAHTTHNNLLLQIRDFDVPLMVFISGIAYNYSSTRGGVL